MKTNRNNFSVILGLAMAIGLTLVSTGCTRPMDANKEDLRFAARDSQPDYPHTAAFKESAIHGEAFLKDSTSCTSCHGEKLSGGVAQAKNCNSCHESYPHSERFKLTALHGKQYGAKPQECATCHGETLDGGPSKLPSCTSCHSVYPHSEAFKTSAMHGASFVQDRESCVSCHNQKRQDLKSCTSCHDAYPHTTSFKTSFEHGERFKEAANKCTNCHDASATGTKPNLPARAAAACVSCHKEYPHTKEFKSSALHGERFIDKPESCVGCHNPERKKRKSCTTCHDTYPHTSTFKATAAHGEQYKQDPESCTSCHSNEPAVSAKPGTPAACTQCHSSYPHTEDFKKSSLHGSQFLQKRQDCLRCHVTGANGKDAEKKGCNDCHAYPHEGNWAAAANHGDAFLGGKTATPEQKKAASESCLKCHGESSNFKDRHAKEFVSCGTCHVMLPHTKSFKSGDDEHLAVAKTYEGNCTSCHTDYKRLMPNTKNKGCFKCHDPEQITQVGWTTPTPSPSPEQ